MEANDWESDKREAESDSQHEDSSCACGRIKTVIADKLHKVAAAVGERAADQDAQPAIARYGKQAADLLDESADYIQHLDYEQTDAKAREYVHQNPGLSLLIAGATGLIIGAIFWRK